LIDRFTDITLAIHWSADICIGDLMGQSLEGLGDLLRMPSGCGEQNMVHFAPDVYILKYLSASEQTPGSIVRKALSFLNRGTTEDSEEATISKIFLRVIARPTSCSRI